MMNFLILYFFLGDKQAKNREKNWIPFQKSACLIKFIKVVFDAVTDKLKLTGLNLGRVFNYRCGHASAEISTLTSPKQPS
jgi:hypothetical protein